MQIQTASRPKALTIGMKMGSVIIIIDTCSIKNPRTTNNSEHADHDPHGLHGGAEDQFEHAPAGPGKGQNLTKG